MLQEIRVTGVVAVIAVAAALWHPRASCAEGWYLSVGGGGGTASGGDYADVFRQVVEHEVSDVNTGMRVSETRSVEVRQASLDASDAYFARGAVGYAEPIEIGTVRFELEGLFVETRGPVRRE